MPTLWEGDTSRCVFIPFHGKLDTSIFPLKKNPTSPNPQLHFDHAEVVCFSKAEHNIPKYHLHKNHAVKVSYNEISIKMIFYLSATVLSFDQNKITKIIQIKQVKIIFLIQHSTNISTLHYNILRSTKPQIYM